MHRKAVILPVLLLFSLLSEAQVRLPRLIRDSMVLQRNSKLDIWGWAAAGEKVTVRLAGKQYKTTTNADGKWSVVLPPMKAGGAYSMTITASNQITINDILIGDVWLCAGQSNMVHQMELHKEAYNDEIAKANYPEIRQFQVPNVTNLQAPQKDLHGGNWKCANPTDVLKFSAVAYFFAKNIYEKYHIPIGIINASWGGTPIEAWTSEEGLKEFPALQQTIEKNKDTAYINGLSRAALAASNANSQKAPSDKGLTDTKPWYDASYMPKGWRKINIPGYWEDQGVKDLDGIVWYRKEIELPETITRNPAKLCMGRIVDADFVYINGKQVGNTGYQYPQRRYAVPAGLLKPGKNVITIRVINYSGKGGFVSDKPYCLVTGNDSIDLKGDWWYKVGEAFAPQNNAGSNGITIHYQPAALFNAMVAPLIPYTMKGIVWYQGESNTGNPKEYAKLLPALISDWRKQWAQSDVPFVYAQLPNFMDVGYLPSESNWAMLREAQLKTLSVPNTAMAVTIELGEWNDIHPDNKKDVGIRLALVAEKVAYGEKEVVACGPLYQSSNVDGNKIVISFTNTGSGLIAKDGEALSEFAIAGADKKFVWAKARIEGNKVIVWNESISTPRYVRYAWADNPDNPNLCNKEGLPASPFRTDGE